MARESKTRYRGYQQRTAQDVLERLQKYEEAEEQESNAGPQSVEQRHGSFFEGDTYYPYLAEALGILVELDRWHTNVMPEEFHARIGERGICIVGDSGYLAYLSKSMCRKRERARFFDLTLLYAICHGIDPDKSLSKAELAQWQARILFDAGLIVVPTPRYSVPTDIALQAFAGLSDGDVKVAVAMLHLIGLKIALCLLRSDTKLVRHVLTPETKLVHYPQDGRATPLGRIDDEWLAPWCYGPLSALCGPGVPIAHIEAKAGEFRRLLFRAGLLARKHFWQFWAYGPTLIPQGHRGLTVQELLHAIRPQLDFGIDSQRKNSATAES